MYLDEISFCPVPLKHSKLKIYTHTIFFSVFVKQKGGFMPILTQKNHPAHQKITPGVFIFFLWHGLLGSIGRHCWILCGLHSFGWKAHVDVTTALAGSRSSVAARHDFANVVAEKMLKSLDSFNQVVVSNMFYFHPNLGKSSNLTNVFQMGWNHQLVFILHHGKW